MIVNKSYTFWNCATHGRGVRYLMSAESRSPAAMTAPTIKHLKTNFSLFNLLYIWILCPVFSLCASVGNTANMNALRIASGSFCCLSVPPFLYLYHSRTPE